MKKRSFLTRGASARRRSGMTLMELVIALAITGMMATAGAAAFGAIIDHRREIRTATVSTERAAALREMLRSWIYAGTIQIQQGGGPRGLTRGAATTSAGSANSLGGMNASAVSAAQASGDEISFTTTALNPSLLSNVRIRLYIDADANTPEKGLTIEYQPNLQMPIVRKMLDSTIDTLHVDFLDTRTNKWIESTQAATITPRAVRIILSSGVATLPPILGLPMMFPIGNQAANTSSTTGR
ncbi:MAG: prepilin-type N-terminal cleavage/methylation domain-containing protein [Gemmatimonadaceae bacterium]